MITCCKNDEVNLNLEKCRFLRKLKQTPWTIKHGARNFSKCRFNASIP